MTTVTILLNPTEVDRLRRYLNDNRHLPGLRVESTDIDHADIVRLRPMVFNGGWKQQPGSEVTDITDYDNM